MNNNHEKWILTSCLILVASMFLFLAIELPLHIDEALTYRHFSSQGWKISISTYPFPNNHVFFSFLTSLFVLSPIDSLFAIRLVSILAGLLNFYLIIQIVRLNYSWTAALFAAFLWASTLAGTYYSVHARGYGLQTTMMLASLYYMLQIVPHKQDGSNKSKFWAGLVITSALGFFTIPTFLFPFGSMMLFALISASKQADFKHRMMLLSSMSAITAILTVLLYVPLFHYAGISSILHNQWVNERSFAVLSLSQYLGFFKDLLAYLGIVPLLLTVATLAIGLRSRQTQNAKLLMSFLVVPLLLIPIMGSLPFPRTFVYLSPIIALFLASNLDAMIQKRRKLVTASMFILCSASFGITASKLLIGNEAAPGHLGKELQEQLAHQSTIDIIYSDGWNETGAMIDFYAWYSSRGPIVKPIYSEQFWEAFDRHEGRYLLSEEPSEERNCETKLKRGSVSIQDCH